MEMKLTVKEASWFLSKEGTRAYADLTSLEDRAIFVYSYLRQVVDESFERDHILFKTAFLIADALCGSSLPYGQYPDVINPAKNPFVAFLKNSKRYKNQTGVFYAYLAILQDVVDPMDKNSWVYQTGSFTPVEFENAMTVASWDKATSEETKDTERTWLQCLEKLYEETEQAMLSSFVLGVPEDRKPIQLKIVWLFDNTMEVR